MRTLHLGLVQQLAQLETRQCQIGDAIAEVNRRIAVLDEVISWNMPEAESEQEFSQEQPAQEAALYEELPLEEMFQEELPQEVSSEEEPTEEEVPQVRQLDTEGTEIQWVNR